MDRGEIDKEARATKNLKNVWKWVLGVGIVLALIAFFGGYLNHDRNFKQAETPSMTVPDSSVNNNPDTTATNADTVMQSVRGTQ